MYQPLKLTKKTAWELISKNFPQRNIKGGETAPGVYCYTASTGCFPDGLQITVENDWFNHNGRFRLTISDGVGGNRIIQYYHPDTLNRDYAAEQVEKEEAALAARKYWVWEIGKEAAHKLVDQYWGLEE
jgi:hypothetical protein